MFAKNKSFIYSQRMTIYKAFLLNNKKIDTIEWYCYFRKIVSILLIGMNNAKRCTALYNTPGVYTEKFHFVFQKPKVPLR
jgi:hypothetical protein